MINKIVISNIFIIVLLSSSLGLAENDVDSIVHERNKLLELQDTDITLGNKDAKVKFIEYSSLSCPACAIFHRDIFEQLKMNYIDKGKVLYIYRDYPMNGPGLAAALVVHCNPENFFKMQETLFNIQDKWAFRNDYKNILKGIARLSGISNKKFDQCVNDEKKADAIISKAFLGAKVLNIDATPTFYINGKRQNGIKDFNQLAKIIDKKINN